MAAIQKPFGDTPASDKVLIVDDQVELRDVLAEYLAGEGFEVFQAANGLEALLQVKRVRPGHVILDLRMPRLGGLEALKRIRAFDSTIAVVILTVDTDPAIRQQALALGATTVVHKPAALPDLLVALTREAPRSREPLATPTAASDAPAAGGVASTAPVSVLVADDDPEVRAMLEEVLGAKGYHVRSAKDGAGAVREIVHAPADIVLLDIDMPVLNGIEALPTVRALVPRAAVIMISGVSDVELATQALAWGAFDYVTKPIDVASLMKSLETAVAMKTRDA